MIGLSTDCVRRRSWHNDGLASARQSVAARDERGQLARQHRDEFELVVVHVDRFGLPAGGPVEFHLDKPTVSRSRSVEKPQPRIRRGITEALARGRHRLSLHRHRLDRH